MQFHVAGALEFFIDDFVHARTGVDQRRCQDGQAAAFLDIARRAEETFRPLQGIGVNTARQDLAGRRDNGIVGPGQPGNRIQQDHHVLLVFRQALRPFYDHFRDLYVAGGGLIERA